MAFKMLKMVGLNMLFGILAGLLVLCICLLTTIPILRKIFKDKK